MLIGKSAQTATSQPTSEPTTNQTFSKAQLEQLSQLFSSPNTLPATSLMVNGSTMSSQVDKAIQGEPWIIDSGASDHMTGSRYLFSSYTPCSSNRLVQIANGSFTPVLGIGNIYLNDEILLSNVLHVSNLSCNLLSISKITTDLECVVKFSPSFCVFQDRASVKMIWGAKEATSLYYFVSNSPPVRSCGMVASSNSSSR